MRPATIVASMNGESRRVVTLRFLNYLVVSVMFSSLQFCVAMKKKNYLHKEKVPINAAVLNAYIRVLQKTLLLMKEKKI